MTRIDKLERQIIGEVWASPEIYANVQQLCDFGSRFSWTEGERRARDFILGKFNDYGLKKVRLATFDYLGWARGEAGLCVVTPLQKDLTSALSLVYSPSTPSGGLRAEVIDVGLGTKAEYEAKGSKIKGRFVMVTNNSPSGQRWVHRREKYGRAVASGAAGFLFVNHLPGMLAPSGSVRSGELGKIPAVGLSHEDGFVIQRLLRTHVSVELEMRLTNCTGPAQFSHVIGEVPGRRHNEVVVVGAHYDGQDISQGAVDNASGTAVVMELARIFGPLAGQLERTLRFETYAAEELGVFGSATYVNAMSDADLAPVGFMLNLDPGVLSGGQELVLQGLEELQPLFAGFMQEMSRPFPTNNRVSTASDHFPYFVRGVPAASILTSRVPGLGRGFGHTMADTLDKVDEFKLRMGAMVAARLLLRLANHEGAIGRKRTPDEIKQILLEHELEEPLRAQGKWPFE